MRRNRAAWELAAQIATDQNGLLTRAQAREAGVCRTSLDRAATADGRWQRVLPAVYATFTGPLTPTQLIAAALLFGGPSAQVSGVTALMLYGCVYLPFDSRVHLLLPVEVHRRDADGVRVHRTRRMPPTHWRDGFAVTPADRAAAIAARHLTALHEVRAMLSEVVQRRLTTPERLSRAVEMGPSAGSALPRRVLDDLVAGCRSAPEMELRDLVRRRPALLATAQWNYRVVLGSTWVVADACWPHARLIVEVDSIEHHGLGDGPERTSRRRAALVAAGWTVLSVSPRRIREDAMVLIGEIETIVARAAA